MFLLPCERCEQVCIIGEGLHKFSKDPYLVCVHGANSTATFDNTILESESSHNSNTLVVQRGATCHINGSRVYASDVGNALKVWRAVSRCCVSSRLGQSRCREVACLGIRF